MDFTIKDNRSERDAISKLVEFVGILLKDNPDLIEIGPGNVARLEELHRLAVEDLGKWHADWLRPSAQPTPPDFTIGDYRPQVPYKITVAPPQPPPAR